VSFDLFLFRLDPSADIKTASALLHSLADKKTVDPSFDARTAVDALLKIEPRYSRRDFDYAALAKIRRTSEEVVREEFDFIAVEGPMGVKLAQFSFSRSYISVSWYSGTTEQELDRYLKELCRVTGYSVFDPQNGVIYRLQPDGELKES
jgi:hypothetical protein